MQTDLALSVVSATELPQKEEDLVLPSVDKSNVTTGACMMGDYTMGFCSGAAVPLAI